MSNDTVEALAQSIEAALAERELTVSRAGTDGNDDVANVVVELPGVKKLKTTALLTVSVHGVRVEAFVCRRPDENFEQVYRYLLKRNRRLYGVAYTIDNAGDIYLVGRFSRESFTTADGSVSDDELDRVLGQVLEAADGDFNTLLEIGFITSIRKEWAWRTSRGESLKNLEAFAHLIDQPD